MALLLALMLGLGLQAQAPAEDMSSIGLVPATVPGKSERFASDLTERVRTGLSRGEFEVVDLAMTGCAEASCAAEAARAAALQHAVFVSMTVDDRDYHLELLVVDGSGEVLMRTDARCELCGRDEVLGVAENEAATLQPKLDTLAVGPPVLVIESEPAGAMIGLDGEPVGTTPLERIVPAGPHTIRADARGYAPQERDIEAVPGVREHVSFQLVALPRTRDRRLRIAGWTAIGVGAAAIVTGSTLIAIHRRPNRLICSGPDRDDEGDCRYIHGTMPAGIGVLVTGVTMEITGIVLARLFRRR